MYVTRSGAFRPHVQDGEEYRTSGHQPNAIHGYLTTVVLPDLERAIILPGQFTTGFVAVALQNAFRLLHRILRILCAKPTHTAKSPCLQKSMPPKLHASKTPCLQTSMPPKLHAS